MTGSTMDDRLDARIRAFLVERGEAAVLGLEDDEFVADQVAVRLRDRGRRAQAARRQWLLVAAAAALIAMLTIVAIGALLRQRPVVAPEDLLIVRDGQLMAMASGSSDIVAFRSGDVTSGRRGYLAVAVSPDGSHVATVRDAGTTLLEPVVEILDRGGNVVGHAEVGPGGVPGVAWSPDGSQFAIAAYPATMAKTSTGDLATTLDLAIYDVSGSLLRRFELPAAAAEAYTRVVDDLSRTFDARLAWGGSGWLVFQSIGDEGPASRMWLANALTGDVRPLDVPELTAAVAQFAVEPAGPRIAATFPTC